MSDSVGVEGVFSNTPPDAIMSTVGGVDRVEVGNTGNISKCYVFIYTLEISVSVMYSYKHRKYQ